MKITFGVTPYSNPQALADWLQAAGHDSEWLGNEMDPEVINNASRVLLGYHHPELSLQVAMHNGEAPQAAMEHWLEQAQRLVACFKANRDTAMLIDLGGLQRAPEEAYRVLMAHWGEKEGEAPEAVSSLPLPTQALDGNGNGNGNGNEGDQSTFLALLARETLHQEPQWLQLQAQLEACSLPLLSDQAPDNATQEEAPDVLFERWQAERQAASRQTEEQRMAQEKASERLKQQESQHAQEKDRWQTQRREWQELQQAHKALQSQKATADKQLVALKASGEQASRQHAELEEEGQLLLEQLHLVQEELERSLLNGQRQDRQLEEVQQRQGLLQRRLIKLREATETQARDLRFAEARLSERKLVERERLLALAAMLQKRTRGEGRQARKTLKREQALITASGLFDRDWYLEQYPDVAAAKVDPVGHYLKSGAGEGRNPSAAFDTAWYLLTYFDVAESGLNPLVHFIRFGRQEQRTSHPNLPALPAPASTE